MLQRIIFFLPSICFKRKSFCIFSLLSVCLTSQFGYSQNTQKQNAQESVALESGKAIEREFTGGLETHSYQIKMTAGQYAKIVIEQRGVDVAAQLFGTDGNLIAGFDSEVRFQEKEKIEFVVEQAGDYRFDVKTKYKNAAGRYEIRLTEQRSASERERALYKAHLLITEASLAERVGKLDEANKFAADALEISRRELGADNIYVAFLLNELGFIQRQKNDYAAESTLQRALAINEKALGLEHPQTVDSLNNLGLVYKFKGDFAKAERLYQQALEITEKTLGSEHPRMITFLLNLEGLYYEKADFMQAERVLKRGLAIAEKTLESDDLLMSRLFNNLGLLYQAKKDYDRAEPFFERALAIYERTIGTESNVYSNTLQNLGIAARERKNYPRALEMYGRALIIREKLLGPEHPNVAALLNNIANIYRAKGDYAKALEMQQRVLAIAEKSVGSYHGLTLMSLGNVAKIYAARGDVGNAVAFQKSIDERLEIILSLDLASGSERQKQAYFDSLAERTDRTVSLHVDLAPDNQTACNLAALVILQRKGRVLDAMSESLSALRQRFNPEDQKLLDRLNSATAQLAKLALNKPPKMSPDEYRRQFDALAEEKEKLESEVSNRSAEFRAQSQPVTLAAVRAAIPPNAALVEFAVYRPFNPKAESNNEAYGAPRYVAYILRQQGEVRWMELGEAKAIDAVIGDLRKALRDPKRKDVQSLARAVDEKVMQPVRSLLGEATQLLVSPDGELNLIPFEALVDEQGRYLIERYSLDYLTGGRDLLRLQTTRTSKSKSLLIANPSFGEFGVGQSTTTNAARKTTLGKNKRQSITATRNLSDTYFAPLGGTIQEARSIQTLFPEAVFLTGTQATESALKQTIAPRILHIATHGFFLQDAENPVGNDSQAATRNAKTPAKIENPLLRSGLALAGANQHSDAGDDGILTALEASGLNLWGTKLVVLSACDTGLGEVKNGEGVYGLRRAFVLAGAETLVMSLWSVSDSVTRELMTNYYKNLKQGIGRGASLRQVQLEMLKRSNRQHPFYWAAFIQSGEWANLDGKR